MNYVIIGGIIGTSISLFIISMIIRRKNKKETEQYVNCWNEAYMAYDNMLRKIYSIDEILNNQKDQD